MVRWYEGGHKPPVLSGCFRTIAPRPSVCLRCLACPTGAPTERNRPPRRHLRPRPAPHEHARRSSRGARPPRGIVRASTGGLWPPSYQEAREASGLAPRAHSTSLCCSTQIVWRANRRCFPASAPPARAPAPGSARLRPAPPGSSRLCPGSFVLLPSPPAPRALFGRTQSTLSMLTGLWRPAPATRQRARPGACATVEYHRCLVCGYPAEERRRPLVCAVHAGR